MTQVEKVSIAGMSFALEKAAFDILDKYLSELDTYYRTREDGAEIVKDIEERIAELIIERNGRDSVVSHSTIAEIISVLGDVDMLKNDGTKLSSEESCRNVKRLFRNTENRILGGVFGGISAYLDIDPIWSRVSYVLLSIVLFFNEGFGCDLMVFALPMLYLILWVAMPKAKTVQQKYAMYGESCNLNTIDRRKVRKGSHYYEKSGPVISGIIKIAGFAVGCVCFVLGILGLFMSLSLILGLEIAGLSWNLMDYIDFGLVNAVVFKIALIASLVLPCIWAIYISLKLLFKLNGPKLGVIIFLSWLVSVIVTAVCIFVSFGKYSDYETVEEILKSDLLQKDTLYINYTSYGSGAIMENIDANSYKCDISYIDCNDMDNVKIVMYPKVRVVRTDNEESYIVYEKNAASAFSSYIDVYARAKNKPVKLDITESGIDIFPYVYTRDNKMDFEVDEVFIYLGNGKTALVTSPLHHDFESSDYRKKLFLPEF